MSNQRLSDIIKHTTEVNLRYSANLLNLSKDYLKAFGQAVVESEQDQDQGDGVKATPRPTQLLVAGTQGEVVKSAFAINNTSALAGTATLKVMGDFGDSEVSVEPDTLTLKTGESAIVRIVARIGAQTPVEAQQPGAVIVNELGISVAEFVVCRLPDPPPRKAPKKARTVKKKS